MDNLAEIFDRWGTDKATNGYVGAYECLFRKGRNEVGALLEIGIGTMIPSVHPSMVGYAGQGYKPGGSLRAWRDFFPNATVYGMDVQRDTQFADEERIVTLLGNSTDLSQVGQALQHARHKTFDIIIDDGSHYAADQIATLKNLFPLLNPSGTYVVEDLVGTQIFDSIPLIVEICGGSPHFFVGPRNNPLVITKRA
jgi:cephalosporin hydroxylase